MKRFAREVRPCAMQALDDQLRGRVADAAVCAGHLVRILAGHRVLKEQFSPDGAAAPAGRWQPAADLLRPARPAEADRDRRDVAAQPGRAQPRCVCGGQQVGRRLDVSVKQDEGSARPSEAASSQVLQPTGRAPFPWSGAEFSRPAAGQRRRILLQRRRLPHGRIGRLRRKSPLRCGLIAAVATYWARMRPSTR